MALVEGPATSGSATVTDPLPIGPQIGGDAVPNLLAERAWKLVRATGLVSDGDAAMAESDRLMEGLVRGLLDRALPLSLAAHGDGTVGPWELFTNPEVATLDTIGYAVQWTGATLAPRLPGETDEKYLPRARLEARRPRGMFRGSAPALLDVALPFLTGVSEPRITAGTAGDEWTVLFAIGAGGVADSAGLERALNDPAVIVAGMKVVIVLSDAIVWDEATTTWDAATDTWDTFNG